MNYKQANSVEHSNEVSTLLILKKSIFFDSISINNYFS